MSTRDLINNRKTPRVNFLRRNTRGTASAQAPLMSPLQVWPFPTGSVTTEPKQPEKSEQDLAYERAMKIL